MIGELDRHEIERLLRTEQIGRLGVTGDGRVYIFPVSYGYDGESIYVISHPGLKVRLMRAHPEVCFEVEQIESPAHWRTVMAHGQFQELTDEAERDRAIAAIVAQGDFPSPPSIAPYIDGPHAVVVYRIHSLEITGRFERDEVLRPAGGPR